MANNTGPLHSKVHPATHSTGPWVGHWRLPPVLLCMSSAGGVVMTNQYLSLGMSRRHRHWEGTENVQKLRQPKLRAGRGWEQGGMCGISFTLAPVSTDPHNTHTHILTHCNVPTPSSTHRHNIQPTREQPQILHPDVENDAPLPPPPALSLGNGGSLETQGQLSPGSPTFCLGYLPLPGRLPTP